MNWKEYFDYKVLDRGFDYYLNEKVYDVVLTDNSITSKVDGSRSSTYEVEINFNKDDIKSMYCTCPYAYSMDYCKHMAATLYTYDDILKNKSKDLKYDDSNSSAEFKNILDNLDEKLLKEYIFKKFSDDKDFTRDFIDTFMPKSSQELYWEYVDVLNNIFDIDLVELYNGNAYFEEAPLNMYLFDFMNNKIARLYNSNDFGYIQKLLYIIYDKISKKKDITQYVDVEKILEICEVYMGKVIENQDILDKDETYNYIINNIRYEYNEYITPHFAWLCLVYFDTLDYQTQTLDVLNEIIDEISEIDEEILLVRYQLMLRLGYPIKNIELELLKYKKYPEILKILTKSAIKEEDYKKAINLLEEDQEEKNSLENTKLLLKLYKKIGDIEKYKENLKSILLNYNINEITYIEQLKEVCSKDEWNTRIEDLIDSYKKTHNYEFLNKIYINEHRYEDLYKNVIDNCPLQAIETYKEYYQEEHKNDILNIYEKIILEEQKTARHKGAYTLIIKYLETMLTYTNSKDTVLELIKTLKNKNKRKKLLIEELEKLEKNIKK